MSPAVDKVNKKVEIVEKTNQAMDYTQIAVNPLQHVLTMVEKKVRNLDKRKAKLDGYRKITSQGGTLDRDQTTAVNKYDEVSGSLEFAKELYKSIGNLQTEVGKAQRKIQRQDEEDKLENQHQQFEFVAKCQFVFKLFFENKSISEDFINGTNNAVVIAQEELEDILKFYENFIGGVKHDVSINVFEKALSAAEHLEFLYEGSETEVCGTTYKNLRATLDKLLSCDYFTNLPELIQEMELDEEDENQEEGDEENEEDVEDESEEESKEEDKGKDETDAQPIPPTEDPAPAVSESPVVESPPAKQTVEDVLADVQGEYNFLQDSMLDFSAGDPARPNGAMKTLPNNEAQDLHYNPNLPPSNIGMENLHGYSDNAELLTHNEPHENNHNTVSNTFYSKRATENEMGIPTTSNNIEHLRNDAPQFKENEASAAMLKTSHLQSYQNFDRTGQIKPPYSSPFNTGDDYLQTFQRNPVMLDHVASPLNPMMPPSTHPSIDPPTTHIPLPNEENSGYQAYNSETMDEKPMNAKETNHPQHFNEEKMMSMKIQKPNENIATAFKNEDAGKVTQNKGHSDSLDMREKDVRDQRNNRPNNHPGMGSYRGNDRQSNNGMNRPRGNYRPNNQNRNFGGHFDSMGHPKNYGPQSNYQQSQQYAYQNNRSQDNQMYGNMPRRGGNGRPNRGYPPRGAMNRGMGNNPMNRPRNMKTLKPEQPA